MSTTTSQELVDETIQAFRARYGGTPRWIAAAPGRVNLIGEHVDYNDGYVMPMAIDRTTMVAAVEEPSGTGIRVATTISDEEVRFELKRPLSPAPPKWSNYVRGVVAAMSKRTQIPSMKILVHSSVPLGSGLSSSAALEVAVATLLEHVCGLSLTSMEKTSLCQKAEHEFAGVPCGIMDQFVVVHARNDHLLLLDCRDHTCRHVPFQDSELAVLILNSNVQHQLGTSEYPVRREQCEQLARKLDLDSLRDATLTQLESNRESLSDIEYKRGKHVVTEIQRTVDFAEAVRRCDWIESGRLMYASHESLRHDFEVSCQELDELVQLAQQVGVHGGVYGSRMTGGGFGGCTVSLIDRHRANELINYFETNYQKRFGFNLSGFVSRPAGGARIIVSGKDN